MSVLKLIAMPPGRIVDGQILWQGRDLVPLRRRRDATSIRAKEIAIVFQEPMTSLNPVYTVGDQIAEVMRLHEKLSAAARPLDKTIEMLRLVQIPNPERRVARLSAPVLRRHAPAGDDRHGAVVQSASS